MRNNLILTMSVLDEPTEVKYVIPQRGIDEIEFYNVFEMDKPGFHVVKRPLVIEEDNNHFTYQSIWLDCYFKDPDDNELLFRFIAGNNYGANSECIACVMEGDSL